MIDSSTIDVLLGAAGIVVAVWCAGMSLWTLAMSSRVERLALASLASAAVALYRDTRSDRSSAAKRP